MFWSLSGSASAHGYQLSLVGCGVLRAVSSRVVVIGQSGSCIILLCTTRIMSIGTFCMMRGEGSPIVPVSDFIRGSCLCVGYPCWAGCIPRSAKFDISYTCMQLHPHLCDSKAKPDALTAASALTDIIQDWPVATAMRVEFEELNGPARYLYRFKVPWGCCQFTLSGKVSQGCFPSDQVDMLVD